MTEHPNGVRYSRPDLILQFQLERKIDMGILILILLVLAFVLCLLGGFKVAVTNRDLGWFGAAMFMLAIIFWGFGQHAFLPR